MRGIEPKCSRADRIKVFEEYYLKQTGSGLAGFSGARYQRGHGLGNVLRKLAKIAMPLLKKGAHFVGKHAMKTRMHIAQDVAEGKNIKAATKRQMSQGLMDLVTQHGRGIGPPCQQVKNRTKVKPMKKTKKIKKGYKRKASLTRTVISHLVKR